MESSWRIILLIFLLGGSGFFSASETALTSLNRVRVRNMVEDNVKGAKTLENLMNNPSRLLGTILVGNNVVNIGASSLATSIAIDLFGNTGVGIATGVMTLLVLVFGEITPKSLAAENSEKIALKVSGPISNLGKILSPIVRILLFITDGISKLLGAKSNENTPFITKSELRTMLNVSHEEGIIKAGEKNMIVNVFDFRDIKVAKIMTPRTDMEVLDIDSTFDEVVEFNKDYKYSRVPVYEEHHDNVVGVFSIKDLVSYNTNKDSFDMRNYLRKPVYLFESQNASSAFDEMRKKQVSIAIVIDEYGGVSGLVTIEDIIEVIVGDIKDEYDDGIKNIVKVSDVEYLIRGSYQIDDLNKKFNLNLQSGDYDTIGGYIIDNLGLIPEGNEVLNLGKIKFTVEKVNKNRIELIRLNILN